ncbi:12652_t:CDS:2 [Entrophospora sp. SA101]|nr:12652_t:CDS:2 [Entrophospora sp. SA101]
MENHENSGRLQNGLENVSNNDVDSDMNLDQSEDKDWTVVKRKERFIVQIEAENVPGGNNNAKLASASKVLSNIQPLVGLNIKYIKGIKYIVATFGTKENADKACELPFAENNSPLTAKKEVLMNILSSYGEITNIKMRAQGTWYKAQITFKDKESMSKFGDKWSIMYLKDSCRIAPLDKPKRILSESQNHLVAEENPHLNDDSINWEFGMPTWLTKVISYWEKHISLEDQFKKMDETNQNEDDSSHEICEFEIDHLNHDLIESYLDLTEQESWKVLEVEVRVDVEKEELIMIMVAAIFMLMNVKFSNP